MSYSITFFAVKLNETDHVGDLFLSGRKINLDVRYGVVDCFRTGTGGRLL
jgi:hypothetical protein